MFACRTSSISAIWGFFTPIKIYVDLKKSKSLDQIQKAYIGSILKNFETNLSVRRNDELDFEDFAIITREQFFEELLTVAFTVYQILPKELIDFVRGQIIDNNNELLLIGAESTIEYFKVFAESHGFIGWKFEKENSIDINVYFGNQFVPTKSYQEKEKERQKQYVDEIMHLSNTIFSH